MLYTSKAVGEWLGITDRQVRNLRDQGVLSEVRPGVFDMKICVRQSSQKKPRSGILICGWKQKLLFRQGKATRSNR